MALYHGEQLREIVRGELQQEGPNYAPRFTTIVAGGGLKTFTSLDFDVPRRLAEMIRRCPFYPDFQATAVDIRSLAYRVLVPFRLAVYFGIHEKLLRS
jgi:hypothetical protein